MEGIITAHQDALMYMYLVIAAGARQALFCRPGRLKTVGWTSQTSQRM